jgi:hypothetical protein
MKHAVELREIKMKIKLYKIFTKQRDQQRDPDLYLSKLWDIQSTLQTGRSRV